MSSPGLADEFPGRDKPQTVNYRQARVIAWNGFTGENTLEVGGAEFVDVPFLNSLEIFGVRVGDVLLVAHHRYAYVIVGRAVSPASFDPTKAVALLRDFSGNIIFAPDLASEQGLGKPFLGIPMHNAQFGTPANTTTSASFESILRGYFYKQHPKLKLRFTVNVPASTTGEARMTIDGIQVGATVALPASTFANYVIGPEEIVGAHETEMVVELQARRASGAGTITLWCNGVTAEQS